MGISTRDTALAHISLNVELQPVRQRAQNLIGLFALTPPNDYHGRTIHVLFEMGKPGPVGTVNSAFAVHVFLSHVVSIENREFSL